MVNILKVNWGKLEVVEVVEGCFKGLEDLRVGEGKNKSYVSDTKVGRCRSYANLSLMSRANLVRADSQL
jgi:hypothetical protein